MLSCGVDDGCEHWWNMPDDFSTMPKFPRRRRCSSCRSLINPGDTVLELRCFRFPNSDIEDRIYGDNGRETATLYACERCGEIMLNLDEAGFDFSPNDNAEELLREYWEMTDFDPKKYQVGTTEDAPCKN